MNKKDRTLLAHGLFVESVIKPDNELRAEAHSQECYNELMEWRDAVLTYLEEKRLEVSVV
jgi:hypothetical protein